MILILTMKNKTLIYIILLGYIIQLAGYRYSIKILHQFNLIVGSAGLGIWVVIRAIRKQPIKIPKFWPVYLAAIASLIISTIFSVWFIGSRFELMLWGICIVIFIAVINLPWDHRAALLDGMLWVGLIYNSIKIIEAVRILFGLGIRPDGRLTDPNNTAAFVNLIIIISLSLIIQGSKKTTIAWVGFGSSLVVLWFTGSRGGSVAGMVGIAVVLIAAWMDDHDRYKYPWRIAAGDLIGSILFISTSNLNRLITDNSLLSVTTGLQARTDIYWAALNIFGDNFWIGSGPNTFLYIAANTIKDLDPVMWIHPHNHLMQILAEAGMIGFITGSLLMLMLLAWLLFFNNELKYKWIGLATMATMITHGLVDIPWYEPFVMRSIIVLMALAVAPVFPNHQNE